MSGQAAVVVDLLATFGSATIRDTAAVELRRPARVDGLLRDALFLHPKEGLRAEVSFDLDLPRVLAGERLFLVFETALSDGIPESGELRPDGVVFTVALDRRVVFERRVTRSLWIPGWVDLTQDAGRNVSVALGCHPGDGIAYDWALWGRPRVVRVRPEAGFLPTNGLLGFRLNGPASVQVGTPDAVPEVVPLEAGFHWFERRAGTGDDPAVKMLPESALDPNSWTGAAWPSALRIAAIGFCEPVQLAGQAAVVRVDVVNDGDGNSDPGAVLRLGRAGKPEGSRRIPVLAPGERVVLRFPIGRLTQGKIRLTAESEQAGSLSATLDIHSPRVRSVRRFPGFRVERGDGWAVVRIVDAPPEIAPIAWLFPFSEKTRLEPVPGKPWVRLSAPTGTELPRIWVRGRRFAEGLVPGVEWLSPGEVSSNARGFGPEFRDRSRPPMEHLCAPLMAVSVGRDAREVEDNRPESWCPDSSRDALVGRPDPARNWSVGLWWAPAPAVRPVVEVPARSRPVDGALLGVGGANEATLCVQPGLVLGILRSWLAATGGVPKPIAPPRSEAETRALCRQAWDRMRGKKAGEWRIVLEGTAEPAPGIAAAALWDALHGGANLDRARADAEAIAPAARADRNGAHVLRWELPFLVGGLPEAMSAVDREVANLRAAQNADGGWGFGAKRGPTARLGRLSDRLSGTGSHAAWMILRHARITGDPESLAAGRRALGFLRRCHLPRGASVWECPIYEPDILAAGWLLAACNEGYDATGDRDFLDEAVYWAQTAVPFVYLWNRSDRPAMRGASIATFGTTFWLHSWIGRPVQWEGLLVAWHLRHLARNLEQSGRGKIGELRFGSDDWRRLVDLVVASGRHQQRTDGDFAGTYPDSIVDFREPQPVHLNPENLAVHGFARAGFPLEIRTQLGAGGVRVSGLLPVRSIAGNPERWTFIVDRLANGPHWVLVERGDAPKSVIVDGAPIASRWEWDARGRRLAIRVDPGNAPARVVVEV